MLKATSQHSPSIIKKKKLQDQAKVEKSDAATGRVFATKKKWAHYFSDDSDDLDDA